MRPKTPEEKLLSPLSFLLLLFLVGSLFFVYLFVFCFFFQFSTQGFSVALGPILKLALVDQAGLELTEILLPLLPECLD